MLLAVDTETTGVTYFDKAFLMSAAWMDDSGILQSRTFDLETAEGWNDAQNHLIWADELVFHNAKFDLQKLHLAELINSADLTPALVHDTEALAHLIDEHQVKRLKVLAQVILGEETDEAEAIKKAKRELKLRASDGFDQLPRELIIPYALKDAEFTLRLFNELYPKVAAHEDLLGLYHLEQELTFVLLEMERNGMALDLEYIEPTAKRYNTEALVQELIIRDMVGNEDFNPNSPKQVTEAFASYGIELEGTGEPILATVDHPLAAAILSLRTLRKMHSTYLKPMMVEQRDGIIHPSFRQHGAKTGRMSSGAHEA